MLFVKKLTYIFIFLFFFNNLSLSHVQHYSELNSITFAIYRNNKHIGEHSFTFINYSDKNELLVTSKINFKIKKQT